ncbi:MAG: C39 family peptidase [Nitrospirota bacterium]
MIKRHSYYRIPGFFWGVLLALLCSCTVAPVHTDSPVGMQADSRPVVIEEVPFYAQEIYQCGPASMAGVLNYWDIAVTPEEIARDIYSPSARGTLTLDMVLYAQRKGLAAKHYSGGWDDLRQKVAAQQPLVVLVDNGMLFYQLHHFMVVVGYTGSQVIVNSGGTERMRLDREKFLASWEKTKFWTLWVHGNAEAGHGAPGAEGR